MSGLGRLAVAAIAAGMAITGALPAFAHTRTTTGQGSHPPPLRGLLTQVSRSSLRVQTPSGGVTVSINAGTTRVARTVIGSSADLAAGQLVDAQFASGTTTIKFIRIDAAQGHEPPRDWWGTPGRTHGTSRTGSGARSGGNAQSQWDVVGQIVSVSANSIALRAHGQSSTYSLMQNISVTKVVSGRLSDLATGETVQVCLSHGPSAAFITILSA